MSTLSKAAYRFYGDLGVASRGGRQSIIDYITRYINQANENHNFKNLDNILENLEPMQHELVVSITLVEESRVYSSSLLHWKKAYNSVIRHVENIYRMDRYARERTNHGSSGV